LSLLDGRADRDAGDPGPLGKPADAGGFRLARAFHWLSGRRAAVPGFTNANPMTGDDFSMMDLFREEVRSHAATLSRGLINLENPPGGRPEIEPLMRAAHSIKGAARIVNIEPAVQLAHVMEDALVAAQEGRIRLGPADIDLLLRGTDVLAGLGEVGEADVPPWSASHAAEIADLQGRFRLMAQGQPAPIPANDIAPPPTPPTR